MEAFMASQSTTPLFPIPRFLPWELVLEGPLDVYEPARVSFKRVLKFVNRPAFADLTSAEIHLFLKDQIPYLKVQVELLALFSGCTLRLLQPHAFDPWLFDVFAWYRQVANRLIKRHADIVTPEWLPDFERTTPHLELSGADTELPPMPPNFLPYNKVQTAVRESIRATNFVLDHPNEPRPRGYSEATVQHFSQLKKKHPRVSSSAASMLPEVGSSSAPPKKKQHPGATPVKLGPIPPPPPRPMVSVRPPAAPPVRPKTPGSTAPTVLLTRRAQTGASTRPVTETREDSPVATPSRSKEVDKAPGPSKAPAHTRDSSPRPFSGKGKAPLKSSDDQASGTPPPPPPSQISKRPLRAARSRGPPEDLDEDEPAPKPKRSRKARHPRVNPKKIVERLQGEWVSRIAALPASFRGAGPPPPLNALQVNSLRAEQDIQPAASCAQCVVRGILTCKFEGYSSPCEPCGHSHAAGPPCTFMATPEERARLTSRFHELGEDALEALQADMAAIQFHTDQALIARQLADTSLERAHSVRARLVAKLRRLYETDHQRAAAAAFAVDDATSIALEGLLENPAPLVDNPSVFLIDQLLLHADPDVFSGDHPHTSAARAALAASACASQERDPSADPTQAPEDKPAWEATLSDEGSEDDPDEVDDDEQGSIRRASDVDYPSGDDSDDDGDAGYQS
ncbi:hypothetical protein HYPSUDRAFT_209989 [Hypholoma sublateritium FD-334 SS-4]|uniref:Uncharacterized protein n=1 Tax=Hypholoma sublateritium (strain FD-334 SS-4) TaxID=945553 RepID=A0A0D2NWJ4_HYPSF|nr:hypothetical protein HYPSUDRAFT_209989 [Hypholoma sublateritium FD-334 SS-4]